MNIIIEIFYVFLKIGAFSFGGGYVMIPLIQREVVEMRHWISNDFFINIIAISQSTPGPIAVNTATFAGYKVSGFYGAIAGTIGVTLVSFCLVVILSKSVDKMKNNKSLNRFFYGLRPAVVAMIIGVAIKLSKTAIIDVYSILILIGVIIGIQKFRVHPLICIGLSGIIGIIVYS